ncbi:hypothetical protein BLNAU_13373 [Blattamonas nauphoetae]|uniref:Uncharacterized protein n=1 Tax=Blattamonas nauphoetae TaxID=2049346 RepID=A0ABQ9XIS5_9EUKA|nr:hypothetical protein BLNAU_13373 [Blattamonas nauphoetae]
MIISNEACSPIVVCGDGTGDGSSITLSHCSHVSSKTLLQPFIGLAMQSDLRDYSALSVLVRLLVGAGHPIHSPFLLPVRHAADLE